MIVPLLLGLKDFIAAPLTWTLVLLNLGFYFVTMDARVATESPSTRTATFFEARNVQRTGVFYLQYLDKKQLPSAPELVLWGGKALRDPGFMSVASTFAFKGDPLEISAWQSEIEKMKEESLVRPSTLFGLSRDPSVAWKKPLTWVTYQFMHASAVHILSNMVFLILFGIAVERIAGSLIVSLVFLLGGIFGAGFALWTDPPSALPMVGASASVSAIMAFYVFAEEKRNIRFFFFFSPFKGFFGDVYLSKWWILPLCLLPDLAVWMSEKISTGPQLLSQSIATSAHVGGALFGALAGVVFHQLFAHLRDRRPEPELVPTENAPLSES